MYLHELPQWQPTAPPPTIHFLRAVELVRDVIEVAHDECRHQLVNLLSHQDTGDLPSQSRTKQTTNI